MSNKRMNITTVLAAALLAINIAQAYETETHAWMGYEAYSRSRLATDPDLAKRLGWDRLDTDRPFGVWWKQGSLPGLFLAGPEYLDNTPNEPQPHLVYVRMADPYERNQMLLLNQNKYGNNAAFVNASDDNPIYSIANWLMRGEIREDDLKPFDYWWIGAQTRPDPDPHGPITRVYGHFFDPIHNTQLLPSAIGLGRATEWGLGVVDALAPAPIVDANRRNHFTWADARENYYLALTKVRDQDGNGVVNSFERKDAADERQKRWRTTFRALGAVMHLLQDMAQPQHTRDDIHSPYISPDERQAYEPYTNARVIGISGLGNLGGVRYIRSFFGGATPSVTPLQAGNYPTPQFATPRNFFTTRSQDGSDAVMLRRGMADYSNRGFFTAGTLPANNNYNFPPEPVDANNGYQEAAFPCPQNLTLGSRQVKCTELLHTVPDPTSPGYTDPVPPEYSSYGGKTPLLTRTQWFDIVAPSFSTAVGHAVTLKDFDAQADRLVPRAIAYSTGLLNYFFRGELKVTSPPGGLFSVLDHGISHYVDSDGYPRRTVGGSIFGFTQLRVRVSNSTPAIVESGTNTTIPQTAKSGKLVAVAKYHRNPCYKPDLSGEYVKKIDGSLLVPAGCNIGQVEALRTPYQEISVSAPVTVDANGNVVGGNFGNACDNVGNLTTGGCGKDSVLTAFDFSADPIPVNATDLFVQVVYRGELGQEKDGIAVGTMDLMEPTYAMTWNNSDWWWHQNAWHPASEFSGTYSFHAMNMCFNDQFIFYTNDGALSGPVTGAVNAGQFVRVALLTDDQPHAYGQIIQWDITATDAAAYPMTAGVVRQASKERVAPTEGINQSFVVEPIGNDEFGAYGRGITFGTYWGFIYVDKHTSSGYTTPEAMFALQPALSGPDGVGRSVSGGVNFTSQAEPPCSQFMPPSVPGVAPTLPLQTTQRLQPAGAKVGG